MNATKKRVKEPVKKGVAQVPVIMQMEALECGAACLTMVLAYYEKWITKEELLKSARMYGKSPYGEHLKRVAENKLVY